MDLQPCKHIRVRGGERCEMDLETLIKSIETEFKTDFTLLPNWKELLKNIADHKFEYKSKIKSANRRKVSIIDKLRVQNFRPSPFNLTDNLARTAYLWKDIELENTKRRSYRKIDVPSISPETTKTELSEEMSDVELTAHPNSEIYQSADLIEPTIQATPVELETSGTHLPINICTNQHKLISPLDSKFSGLNIEHKDAYEMDTNLGNQDADWMLLNKTNCIICKPSVITIDTFILSKQVTTFFLTNSCSESLYIRFKTILDKSVFKKATIYPKTPLKLCPGLTATYKFVFKLVPNIDNLNTSIYFRIGRNVTSGVPEEILNIPVSSKVLEQEKNIYVTEMVNIIPIYSWQINVSSNFPHGKLQISVADDHSYHVEIKKRVVDFVEETENHNLSVDVTGISTESLMQKMEDHIETKSTVLSTTKKEDSLLESESTSITEIFLNDIVNMALDTFILEKTFLHLGPNSKRTISILLSKVECEGYHQCCYDVKFYNPSTDVLVTTKSIKVFAEVLPHIIQIYTKILDMSESPINFGYREDYIVVTNTHKIFPVKLNVLVTKKMRLLFKISPMEMTIPNYSSANLFVRVCSKHFDNELNKDDLVHFTIKIIVSGHESVYGNVPPIFYELIIPCATEYNKIYNNM